MSKIEEMANEATAYIPENEVMDMEGCAYTTIDEVAKTWYMLGAVAVLKEIEDIVYRRYSDDGDPNQRNKDLIKLIQQLKG